MTANGHGPERLLLGYGQRAQEWSGARMTERRRQRRLRAKYASGDQEETEGEHVSAKVGSTQDNNEVQRKVDTHTKHGYIHKDMDIHAHACRLKQTNRPSARAIELSRGGARSAEVRSSRESYRAKRGAAEDQSG